jgi:hypothetical protein
VASPNHVPNIDPLTLIPNIAFPLIVASILSLRFDKKIIQNMNDHPDSYSTHLFWQQIKRLLTNKSVYSEEKLFSSSQQMYVPNLQLLLSESVIKGSKFHQNIHPEENFHQ